MNIMYEEDLRNAEYNSAEIRQIDDFLAKVCEQAHGYVVNIFTRAKLKKKDPPTFSSVMVACNVVFHAVWKYGTSGCIANVDDCSTIGEPNTNCPVSTHGARNWMAFTGIYEALGMGCPKML